MKFIEQLEKEEYEQFVSTHKKSHFMQSYYFGEVMKYKNFIPYYVGLKKNNKLIATALLLKKKLIKDYCYFYSPRGFILDYNNFDLLEDFTREIKKFAKKNKAIFVKIDPDVKRRDLDQDGQVLGNDNQKLIDKLISLNYKSKGFNTEFVNEQPRFTFRLNLKDNFDNIYAKFHSTTRKILNKKNEYQLDTYIGTKKDIDLFYQTMKETAIRENIICSPKKYYENFYEILNNNDMSDLYIVKANIINLKNITNNKLEEIHNKIDLIKQNPNKKTENKLKELNNELNKIINDKEKLEKITEKELVLSSIITVKYNDKVWTVHGGNSTELRNLNSNYWLYYTIIKDAYNNKYKVIDFFGTSGIANPEKDNPIYGIHNFKKRLGGEYIEFIGEFDLVCKPFLYFTFNLLIPIRRKIIKNKLRRKKDV